MPPSSNAYSNALEPSRRGRGVLLASALLLTLLGWLPILTLPWPPGIRAALAVGWTVFSGLDYLAGWCAIRHVAAYSLHPDEGLVLRVTGGPNIGAEVMPGTIVLGRVIWLRFRDERGRIGAELIPGNPRRQPDFRRALVVLRLAAGRADR